MSRLYVTILLLTLVNLAILATPAVATNHPLPNLVYQILSQNETHADVQLYIENFTAEGYDGLWVSWNFGDGQIKNMSLYPLGAPIETITRVNHSYVYPANYTVRAEVWNGAEHRLTLLLIFTLEAASELPPPPIVSESFGEWFVRGATNAFLGGLWIGLPLLLGYTVWKKRIWLLKLWAVLASMALSLLTIPWLWIWIINRLSRVIEVLS